MPIIQHNRHKALKRAALAALIEAADALPGLGPLLAGAGTFYQELRRLPRDLPTEARDAVQAMAGDFQASLEREAPSAAGQTLTIALSEALAILAAHGLSDEELVRKAGLTADVAAQRTLEREASRLRLLEADVEAMARRLVEEYYRVLLSHRDALAHVGVPALETLLARTEGLEQALRELADLMRELAQAREREAWQALRPVEELIIPAGPVQLAELKAPNRLVPFTGQAHHRLRDEMVAWAEGVAAVPGRVGLCLLFGPGGTGKSRVGVETGWALIQRGWQAHFLPSQTFSAEQARVWVRPPRPTLLILDYAENRMQEVETLLQAAADLPERKHPLALLFLLRPDPRDKDQPLHRLLRGVAGRSPTQTAFWHQTCAPAVEKAHRVPELAPDDRPALFAQAQEMFRRREGVAPREAVTYPAKELPERPLAVILLALLAAHGRRVAESSDEQRILAAVWEWEWDKWRRYLQAHRLHPEWEGEALGLIEAALAAATLGRPLCSPEEVAAFWEANLPPRRVNRDGQTMAPQWLAQHLPTLFPAPAEEGTWQLPPIVPDPLADLVVSRQLTQQDSPTEYLEKLLSGITHSEHLSKVGIVLHRCLALPGLDVEDRVLLDRACECIDRRLPPSAHRDVITALEQQLYVDSSRRPLLLQSFCRLYKSGINVGEYLHNSEAFATIVQHEYNIKNITEQEYNILRPS